MTYTTASLFLTSLSRAGITHAFVNWGSDHPAFLEDLSRRRNGGDGELKIVTCPNEMVALSAAQGYAQMVGKPAAVIVHVDVGTQALAGAVHNVDRSRTPVLIFAGASPFSQNGEHKGGRNEFIMWYQDIPDQAAIVRQYMRYTGQIQSGVTAPKMLMRALQLATSEPQGPAYLWARREVMEEELDPSLDTTNLGKWPAVSKCALPPDAATQIAQALLTAQSPLLITSHLTRSSPTALTPLTHLSILLSIPIHISCPSVTCVPFSHPLLTGISYAFDKNPLILEADVILVIESEVPWIEHNLGVLGKGGMGGKQVFVIDSGDPLRDGVGYWHLDAEIVARADAELALGAILEQVRVLDRDSEEKVLGTSKIYERGKKIGEYRQSWLDTLRQAEEAPSLSPSQKITVPQLLATFRAMLSSTKLLEKTLILNEGISNYVQVWSHLQPEAPIRGPSNTRGLGMITSGASSLGWGLGAAVGVCLGNREGARGGQGQGQEYELVALVVGDGSYLFGVPASAFWMARRYQTPFLTIVLNNGGWKVRRLSRSPSPPGPHPLSSLPHPKH
ncbi:hypothetical protein JAAARDRAFT_42531 [Jaapia argillacea MUCL 33604]|uniref:Pyruvate decarboxylase n=1 Tax=Jaapia argillacea MUCL 33604 TaxID=933084 RepID=A0A067PG26_9AGAM|nr:hypothetical protein JAAARDRAFT_42531 [Jaapia argillacea MUCL 33604]